MYFEQGKNVLAMRDHCEGVTGGRVVLVMERGKSSVIEVLPNPKFGIVSTLCGAQFSPYSIHH